MLSDVFGAAKEDPELLKLMLQQTPAVAIDVALVGPILEEWLFRGTEISTKANTEAQPQLDATEATQRTQNAHNTHNTQRNNIENDTGSHRTPVTISLP